ncbi:helix-turn-helix domain-containing protein [Jeotgalibaca arthritidis]|uniref:Helix-turn-helix domain-containing protein n=1 Tax=Jeotgalibaca arthritidis TaxID=1868794 RepID=A0A6G7KBG2_9LACT|nr:helix-turn-helix domain-containing protein [Jeotgalibaca arthritidis]QII82608.1 helix-turn-helix domain-containing protein [Jeotgalibaca arthritidis]
MTKFAKLRRGNGLTQNEVAKAFNITRQAYSAKERGLSSFSDKEKVIFIELVKPMFPRETIESIFFTTDAKKSKD